MVWKNGAFGDCGSERGVRRNVLLLHPVQGFPAEPENGDNHRKLCDDLVQDTGQGAGHGVVDNPERRVDKHAGQPDFPGIMGISCNCRGNIGRDREDGDPAGPGENQGYNLKKAAIARITRCLLGMWETIGLLRTRMHSCLVTLVTMRLSMEVIRTLTRAI